MGKSFDRLKIHLRVCSFVDVAAVRGVTQRLGQKDMSLVHVEASIKKARQTAVIAERRSFSEKVRSLTVTMDENELLDVDKSDEQNCGRR